jgi:hypothetical protein
VILVVSNVANESADDLVGMFPSGAASLVTASNFNEAFKAGISVRDFGGSQVRIGGIPTRPRDISGVISTIPCFHPQELYYIEPADRDYVCSELSAFLIYFLSELDCLKLNPPSSRTLCGLGMHRIEWLRAAHRCGVPLFPIHLKDGIPVVEGASWERPLVRATLIGDTVVGNGAPERIAVHMRTLARAFAMPYLACVFVPDGDDYQLADLSSVPDITVPENREAILNFMGQAA